MVRRATSSPEALVEMAAAAVWPRDVTTLSYAETVVEATAKEIREMCGRPRSYSAADCVAAIEALDAEIAAQVVQRTNCNGKAPLHFAAQNRQSGDCVLVCDALLRRGAVVNATTERGHTPLIYAAGRGRSEAVSLLLDHGANPRVICVTGHTAAQMGIGHVDDECIELLEAAEKSSQQEWLDFRTDAAAVEAHTVHCKSCPSCRLMATQIPLAESEKVADVEVMSTVKAAIDEMLQITEAAVALTMAIAQRQCNGAAANVLSISCALLEGQEKAEKMQEKRTGKRRSTRHVQKTKKPAQNVFKICLAPLPPGAPHRLKIPAQPETQELHTNSRPSPPFAVVRLAIQCVLFASHIHKNLATLETVIAACGEEMLRRALKSKGTRDRRVIRPLLGEVLGVLNTMQGRSLLRQASVRSLVATAEPHLAGEILMLRSVPGGCSDHANTCKATVEREDVLAEEGLWQMLVAELSSTCKYGAKYVNGQGQPPEVVWLSGRRLRKRDGGIIVALLLRLLRLAWALHQDDSTNNDSIWQDRLAEVCEISCKGGGTRRLHLLMTAAEAEILLPADATKDLRTHIVRLSSIVSRNPATKSSWQIDSQSHLPARDHGQWAVYGSLNCTEMDGTAVQAEGELEQYKLDATQVVWVGCDDESSAEVLRRLLHTLQDLATELATRSKEGSAARLMIGIDTEWGELADQVDAEGGGTPIAAPAIMQLAVRHSDLDANMAKTETSRTATSVLPAAWVIDCSNPSSELRQLTSWLLGLSDSTAPEPQKDSFRVAPVLLGFAFAHDISRLFTLSGRCAPPRTEIGTPISAPTVIDLQNVAMRFAHRRIRSVDVRATSAPSRGTERQWNMPGLGLVCATFLEKRLDKAEQCSDWDCRPLSDSQIAYAAADAAVLVDIADAMGISCLASLDALVEAPFGL